MSADTKKQLEIAVLVLTLLLAAAAGFKSWAITPYRIDELTSAQAATATRMDSLAHEQNVVSSDIRSQLATISESQRSFRRDIDEIKGDLKAIKNR